MTESTINSTFCIFIKQLSTSDLQKVAIQFTIWFTPNTVYTLNNKNKTFSTLVQYTFQAIIMHSIINQIYLIINYHKNHNNNKKHLPEDQYMVHQQTDVYSLKSSCVVYQRTQHSHLYSSWGNVLHYQWCCQWCHRDQVMRGFPTKQTNLEITYRPIIAYIIDHVTFSLPFPCHAIMIVVVTNTCTTTNTNLKWPKYQKF